METSFYTLLFVLALDRGLEARSGRAGPAVACGVFLGLLGMTRPEGVLVGLLFLGLMALWPETRRNLWRAALPFVCLIGGLELFRLWTYGALVPNTYQAKPPSPVDGWKYFREFALYGLGVVGPLATVPALRRSAFARGVAVVALVLAAGTVWSGGDWMPGYRRFSVTMVGLAVLVGAGVALARGAWRVPSLVAAAAVLAGHLWASLNLWDAGLYPTRAMVSLALAANATPGVKTVALTDIGRFGPGKPAATWRRSGTRPTSCPASRTSSSSTARATSPGPTPASSGSTGWRWGPSRRSSATAAIAS